MKANIQSPAETSDLEVPGFPASHQEGRHFGYKEQF
jgi:hypothetical protein